MMRSVVTVALLVMLLAGCGQPQTPVEPPPTPAAGVGPVQAIPVPGVATKGDSVTIKGNQGEAIVVGSGIPDELKNFPVPQGFRYESGGSMSSGADKFAAVNWVGKGTLKAVADFYKKVMPEQGWTETASVSTTEGLWLTYEKGDKDSVALVAAPQGDEVTLSAVWGKASQQPGVVGKSAPQPGTVPAPAGPATTDPSTLPSELKDIPVPAGFAVIKGSARRETGGGQFSLAEAAWFGQASTKEAFAFFQKTLPAKGWNEASTDEGEDQAYLSYSNAKDSTLLLEVDISKDQGGTEILMRLFK